MASGSLMVFTGNANPKLAADVVRRLGCLWVPPQSGVSRTARSMSNCWKRAWHGRLILQSDLRSHQREHHGIADHGGCAQAGFGRPHHRSDSLLQLRPSGPPSRSARVPITAKVVANMLQAAGVQRVLTVDLPRRPDPGFLPTISRWITSTPRRSCSTISKQRIEDLLVVSPDVGGVVRPRAFPSASNAIWRSSTSAVRKANVSGDEHHR